MSRGTLGGRSGDACPQKPCHNININIIIIIMIMIMIIITIILLSYYYYAYYIIGNYIIIITIILLLYYDYYTTVMTTGVRTVQEPQAEQRRQQPLVSSRARGGGPGAGRGTGVQGGDGRQQAPPRLPDGRRLGADDAAHLLSGAVPCPTCCGSSVACVERTERWRDLEHNGGE